MTSLTLNNGSQAEIVKTFECSDHLKAHLIESGWKPVSYLVRFERRTRQGMRTFLATARIANDGNVALMGAVAE